jgi:hypothetical protein
VSQKKKLVGLILAATLLVSSPVFASTPVVEPVLPANAVQGTTHFFGCPTGVLWRTFYDTTGKPDLAEIVLYGRGGSDKALVWVFFLPDTEAGFSHAILTLPDKPAEQLTRAELDVLDFCDLPVYM